VLPYPPFVAVHSPLAALPLRAFGMAVLALNLALVVGAVVLLDRFLGLQSIFARGFVALGFLTLTSVAWVVDQGQMSMLVFYGWLGFVWFERQDRPRLAGPRWRWRWSAPQMLVLLAVPGLEAAQAGDRGPGRAGGSGLRPWCSQVRAW
jgi:hypothetical protein